MRYERRIEECLSWSMPASRGEEETPHSQYTPYVTRAHVSRSRNDANRQDRAISKPEFPHLDAELYVSSLDQSNHLRRRHLPLVESPGGESGGADRTCGGQIRLSRQAWK
jgi:hypothetical protein